MSGMVQVPFGHTFINRTAPVGPPQAYKTYGASMPLETHWVPATCDEVDCEPFLHGWSINVAPLSEQDIATIKQHGYRYQVLAVSAEEILWIFDAGQPCFKSSEHRMETGRPPVFYTRPGDWRGDPTGRRPYVHDSAENWVDDMATHLDRLRTENERG
ncbi:MAG TPA: hypothetical protein VHX38_18800 [Pseudonocardiaceae bacterium]|jgi:hypothetical protein|nr:hypothetical protein [Pseudonocardiaceae bacterium]